MRSSVLRVARQQLRGVPSRRYASTVAPQQQPAQKAKEAAGKAVEILSKSGESFAKLAAKTGGRTGKLLKTVQSAIPPTIYYSKVAAELAKLVFKGQKMAPPDLAAFKETYKQLLNPANYPNYTRTALQALREGNAKDLVFVGVLTAEVIGFFKVGEIIGRRKLVGYRGAAPATHH
ncbi:mitochondrial ATP synthase g subunit-domain-containing protein [Sphaerosporella brunnea]|uniref:Mitochondrial ATP synthase g subunit-domain-containing protein n=1 Tax=Sphaerosporella brunnea TaxID=1250544 RepID=A0A5J5EW89_9PEZI|nr:mitochondrial ATP synthase g subunit-domain-containing protein [Sphaerosporella brunnea]